MATEKSYLNFEVLGYYDEKFKAWVSAEIETAGDNYDPAGTAATLVNALETGKVAENATGIAANKTAVEKAQEEIDAVEVDLGNVDELSTTNKTVVSAINEVLAAVGTGGTAAVVTMTTETTTEGALKSYTFKQGNATIGTIDIPKDMVVESGEVVDNPEGQPEGKYIKLVLANVADPLYINVGTLVDIYKAQANATQIQLTIDSSTREISAVIVAGSVGTTELADNAVTTVKIADANVTLAKLSSAVQTSLGKADTAVQSVVEGTANGTIAVDGTDVAVHGLGSAAYTESSAYDVAGAADEVQAKLDEEVTRAKAAEEKALTDAKAYTDEQIGDVDLSGIATNAATIEALQTSKADQTALDAAVARITANEEELASYKEVTKAQIDSLFA